MKILKQLNLDDVVFIDIETVAAVEKLDMNSFLGHAWDYKLRHGREPLGGENNPVQMYWDKAALYAEFGKIVCVTIGKVVGNELKVRSYANNDEKQLLIEFTNGLNAIIAANKNTVLAGHAIKGFDLPWLMRRCIVHQIELPTLLDTAHLKPWETTAIDTSDLWKGTGFNGASLISIAAALNILNPKDDIEGFQTTEVYYKELDGLQRIARYCEKDVLAVANIVRRCRYEPLLTLKSVEEIKVKSVGVINQIHNSGGKITPAQEKELSKKLKKLPENKQKIAQEILNIATA